MSEPWTGGPIMDRPGKTPIQSQIEQFSILAYFPRDSSVLEKLPPSVTVTKASSFEELVIAAEKDKTRPIVIENTGNSEHFVIGGQLKKQGYVTILCGAGPHTGAAYFDFNRQIKQVSELPELLRLLARQYGR